MSVQTFTAVHPIVVDIFQPKWWTNQLIDIAIHRAMELTLQHYYIHTLEKQVSPRGSTPPPTVQITKSNQQTTPLSYSQR